MGAIQGDTKAFASIGCYAATVIVGVTAPNTIEVRTRYPVPLDVISGRLDAVLDDLPIRAIKVGTTSSVEVVELIGAALTAVEVPIVVDPVTVTVVVSWLSHDSGVARRATRTRHGHAGSWKLWRWRETARVRRCCPG